VRRRGDRFAKKGIKGKQLLLAEGMVMVFLIAQISNS
tara:strand:+ start:262 stop:372 length:111 start_codon:yes stop_codon:yes gene_type:complete